MAGFYDLNIAVSALQAQQYAMDVTGQNISNADTTGYHDQTVVFTSATPLTGSIVGGGIGHPVLGTGVLVQTVQRAQTDYLDSEVRNVNSEYNQYNSESTNLTQAQSLLQEPDTSTDGTGTGISTLLNNFWSSWQTLSTTPTNESSRVSVEESGQSLASGINTLYTNLTSLQSQTNTTIATDASTINNDAKQIATLNSQITTSIAGGYQPNDLIDQRNQLLQDMSNVTNVTVYGTGGSDMIVSIGGKALVQGNQVNPVEVTQDANGNAQVSWSDDGSAVNITSGEIKGLMNVRDTTIPGYLSTLNSIASSIITQVNAVHSTGTTMSGAKAGDFFTGTDASNIAVNGQTIGDTYDTFVTQVGADVQETTDQANTYNSTLTQLNTQSDSISGVSMDQEMSNMVKFQQGYNAAARIFTTMNDMLDNLITNVGVVTS
jgi:flagellar hook-associated protein 1 FlgK